MPKFIKTILIFSVYAYIIFSIVGKGQISAENYGGRKVIKVPKVLSLIFIPFKGGKIPISIFIFLLNLFVCLIVGIVFYYFIDEVIAPIVYWGLFLGGLILEFIISEITERNL